jgi:HD-GYP domain-containing protein (c-di-GMP phosphodiesterase class II)
MGNAGDLFGHRDRLRDLGGEGDLNGKLALVHRLLREACPEVDRIAVALFEEERGIVKTYLASDPAGSPLLHYEVCLEDAPSLKECARQGRCRVVNDLDLFRAGRGEHTRRIREGGFRASYTVPMFQGPRFLGFLFFNSRRQDAFTPEVLDRMDPYAHLIEGQVVREVTLARTLLASVRTIIEVVHYRDPETGNHLKRMARFARLIARHLAAVEGYPLTDEYIERIFLYAPMHDVGKVAIPDQVLLKPARLDDGEWAIMRTHATLGREIVDRIIRNFDFPSSASLAMLRSITEAHHEALDGTGYPQGTSGEGVPLEARIVTVADVFDALTSHRPHKPAWSNQDAFDYLRGQAASRLDARCVEALHLNRATVEQIQQTFSDKAPEPG